MSTPGFLHQDWLIGLLGAWLVVGLAVMLARRRAERRRRLLLGETAAPGASWSGDGLLLLALLGIAIALAGPRWGLRTVRSPASGVDVVVLVDVSLSMNARDLPPSRIDRARELAGAVLSGLEPGDRAALAVFAGRGALLTPLTSDKQALLDLLPALDESLLSERGSRLDRGLDSALEAFRDASPRPRVVLVLSDGEDPRNAPPARWRAGSGDFRILAAAFGTEAGARVPHAGRDLLDARGRPVISRRDLVRLEELAAGHQGELFQPDRWGRIEGRSVLAAVRRDAPSDPEGWVERRVVAVRFAPLAGLALLLLLLESGGLSPARRSPRPGRHPGRAIPTGTAATALVSLWALGLLGATPAGRSEDARALLELGIARAEAGATDEARRAFFAAAVRAEDRETAAMAYYDLGVAALRAGALEDARDAFFDAIALEPGDRQALFNLEWTLRALAAPTPPPIAPPPEPGTGEGKPASQDPDPSRNPGESSPMEAAPRADEDPDPTPRASDRGARRPLALEREAAAHWLDAVQDDPSRALQNAARASAPEEERTREQRDAPVW